MIPELPQIKQRRLKLALKQGELAKLAGVSQSMIAKVESGRLEPSYSKAKKIFEALDATETGIQQKAKDIMSVTVHYVRENDTLKHVAKLMREKNISQVPVLRGSLSVGGISETTIIERVNQGISIKALNSMLVKDVMDEPFPVIRDDTPVKAIYSLLEYSPALIVRGNGKIVGIISRADLLKLR
ncbi:CBS domain-containing protein [archaeon]|nr:CBS domain-containing protein [archaeon]